VESSLSASETLISDLIRPTVEALGVDLWGIEHLIQGKYSVLRVYIDKAGDGVTIEDCERVSRQISGIFDVEDPIPGEYTLEVSSPGMDRPLFTIAQFAQYVGSEATVKLRSPLDGRRKFKGLIQKVDADVVSLLVDGKEFALPALAIDKANLVF
jgi:ribosome maturation factor RimP